MLAFQKVTAPCVEDYPEDKSGGRLLVPNERTAKIVLLRVPSVAGLDNFCELVR